MSGKINRRIAMGTIIGGLTAGPFIIFTLQSLCKKQLPEGSNSPFSLFREEYGRYLTFPRSYNITVHNYRAAMKNLFPGIEETLNSMSDKEISSLLDVHMRYWKNFSKIDTIEFDYVCYMHNATGKKMPYKDYGMNVHAWIKYGYGMTLDGKDDKGEPFYFTINLDGEVDNAVLDRTNMPSLMLSFFNAMDAVPLGGGLRKVSDYHVSIPDNPYMKSADRFTLCDNWNFPRKPKWFHEMTFSRTWFNEVTGLPELSMTKGVVSDDFTEHERKYGPSADKELNFYYSATVCHNVKIDDNVFLPDKTVLHLSNGDVLDKTYNNIIVKFV